MTSFSIVHDFDGTPDAFWRVFFHEPYNVELYKRLKMKERTVLYREDDEQQIRFSIRVVPERDLPGFLKKIVGGDLGYVETSVFHRAQNRLDVKVEPTLMKERTKIAATYQLVETSPGKLRRTFSGTVDISIPLAGGKIEGVVIEDMRKSYDTAAQVTREWLARGGVPA